RRSVNRSAGSERSALPELDVAILHVDYAVVVEGGVEIRRRIRHIVDVRAVILENEGAAEGIVDGVAGVGVGVVEGRARRVGERAALAGANMAIGPVHRAMVDD